MPQIDLSFNAVITGVDQKSAEAAKTFAGKFATEALGPGGELKNLHATKQEDGTYTVAGGFIASVDLELVPNLGFESSIDDLKEVYEQARSQVAERWQSTFDQVEDLEVHVFLNEDQVLEVVELIGKKGGYV